MDQPPDSQPASDLYRAIFERSNMPIVVADDRGVYVEANDAAAELCGLPREDMIGRKVSDFAAAPDATGEQWERFRQTAEEDGVFLIKRPDGAVVPIEYSAVTNIVPGRHLSILKDISDRVRYTEGLQRAEQRYRDLAENANDMIYTMALDGRFLTATGAGYRLLGYTEDEICQMSFRELLTPVGVAMMRERAERRAAGVASDDRYELEVVRKDGDTLWVEVVTRLVQNAAGEMVVHGVARDIADRRRADNLLTESEERHRNLLEALPTGLWLSNGDRITFSNSAMVDLSGYTREEIGGPGFLRQFIHPEDADEMIRRGQARLRGESPPSTYRVRVVRKDGEVRWVEIRATLITFRDEPAELVATHDISEQQSAEDELRASEERLRALLDGLPVAIFVSTGEDVVYANTAAALLTGWDIETLTTPVFFRSRVVHADDVPTLRSHAKARIRGEQVPNQYELKLIHRDGTEIPVEFHATRVEFGGQVMNLVAAIDLRERIRAEQEVRESEARLRAMLEGLPVSTWIFDGNEVVFVNAAAEALTGYSREELTTPGHFGERIMHPDDEANVYERGQARVRGEDVSPAYEARLIQKDGTICPVEINATLLDFGGKPVSMVAAIDLREHKRAEEERRTFESRLQHAQKLESLGLLAGGIAHDFNNLLVGILGNADIALSEMSPEAPMRPVVSDITTAAQRAADLTRQMLAYSGKGRFVIRTVDLAAVVEEMASLVEASISKKAILRFDFTAGLPPIEADTTQLQQVVMNLIINAADALGGERGVVTVATGRTYCDREYLSETYLDDDLPEGEYIHLEVSDTGVGMDEQTRQRVFEPFFTTKFTGRGLGLAAVLGIVRGHRGAIKVYSEPGRGTSFKVLFPPANAAALSETEAAPAAVPWRGSGLVLLIDDDPTVRTVTSKMLANLGFGVLAAADGVEGIEYYREHHREISLVILDLTMPHLDGTEVFQQLRRMRQDVRVLLTSGYNEQDATNRFVGKGLAGFIQKPFRYADLIAAVRGVLETERVSEPGV